MGNVQMVTRFAPSPTGYLHIGHVVNAIYVWRMAREAGGRVLLRIEDHDRVRCRPEYEVAILEDLEWLGFEPDEGLRPLLRQSDRARLYEEALVRLRTTHHVYACDCSRKQIAGGVTHIIRGADLLSSTGRQLRLARMLGRRDTPVYLHHPLVLKPKGEKLSKSAADTGVRELRRAGMRAADVIALATERAGLGK